MPDLSDDFHLDLIPDLDMKVGKLPEVIASAEPIARKIAEIARSTAPFESGDYQDGIEVQTTKHGARVLASDPKSAWIEFGVPSRGIPAKWNLRRAAEALGLKFRGH
ncbi:hypothetical protein [Leifsonia sp. NPDC058248]|uniref:hypothetical protein n=1 Tax=Leifsonia sp. NPDC058248 TaxID=3346402 RepID=UPI0036DDA18E